MLSDAGIIIEEPGYLRNLSGYKNLDFLYRIRNKPNKQHLQDTMQKIVNDSNGGMVCIII